MTQIDRLHPALTLCTISAPERVFWGVLAGVHVMPLVQVVGRFLDTPTSKDGISLALLVVVAGLFVLKAAGVRFLRFHCKRTSLTAFILATAVAHGSVLSDDGRPELFLETTTAAVIMGGAAFAAWRVRRRLVEILHDSFCRAAMLIGAALRGDAECDVVSREYRCLGGCCVARAPPFLSC